eukprot:SAG31_NODE_32240_length_358_cov_0.795367_1_plen_56_part_01
MVKNRKRSECDAKGHCIARQGLCSAPSGNCLGPRLPLLIRRVEDNYVPVIVDILNS